MPAGESRGLPDGRDNDRPNRRASDLPGAFGAGEDRVARPPPAGFSETPALQRAVEGEGEGGQGRSTDARSLLRSLVLVSRRTDGGVDERGRAPAPVSITAHRTGGRDPSDERMGERGAWFVGVGTSGLFCGFRAS